MNFVQEMHLKDIFGPLASAATREAFGDAVAKIGELDQNVVALSADVAGSVQLSKFASKFPNRFFNVGVAEQNLASVAAGLGYSGKTVFIGAFAAFCPGRNWEQIRTTICYGEANVKIEGSHAGLDVGEDGATHQMLEDLALMRCLPNMTVICPCDYNEAYKAVFAAWKTPGPFYIRCTRGKLPIFTSEETPFELGKLNLLCDGSDLAIVATGNMVFPSLVASSILEKEGISVAVANMHTISHPDAAALEKLARHCGAIVTVEDHQVKGGLGSAVCEALSCSYPVPVIRHGVQMSFGESGPGQQVLSKHGLDAEGIAKVARQHANKR
ncbi:MAG: transketolase family protein [Candidatus Micrarchaeota archaeon]|nr:transketolase family protein [Candidatus Micrarchaeota archaeon]